jgi:hypothetical protein
MLHPTTPSSLQAEIRAVEDASARCHSMLCVLAQALQDGTSALEAAAGDQGTEGSALDLGASVDLHRLLGTGAPRFLPGGSEGKPPMGENLSHALGLDDTATLHTLRLQRVRLTSLGSQAEQAEELRARCAGLWGQVRAALEEERARQAASSLGRVEMADLEEAAKDMDAVEQVVEGAICALEVGGAACSGDPRGDAFPLQAYTKAGDGGAGQGERHPRDARLFAEVTLGECVGSLAASLVDLLQAEARRLREDRAGAAERDGGACDRRVDEADAAAVAISRLRAGGAQGVEGVAAMVPPQLLQPPPPASRPMDSPLYYAHCSGACVRPSVASRTA